MDIDKQLIAHLRAEEAIERAKHEPSGKLSASWLNKPLLEQVLKIIGVPTPPIQDYTLKLFKRGKQVEQLICEAIDGDEQVEVEYRGVVGVIDKIHNGVPIEVKSVKDSHFKWLEKTGANKSYQYQAALYALAKDTDHATIVMATSGDLRIIQQDVHTAALKPEIDAIIDEVNTQLKSHLLPPFKGREDYHDKLGYADTYSSYGEWVTLSPELAMEKLKNQYPDAFKKLKEYK